jgi:HK97 family phage portal protein
MEINSASAVQTKSASISPYVSQMLFGNDGGIGDLTASGAMTLWSISDTVYNAIDLIAGPFSQMSYSLKDKKTGEYLTGAAEHPLLALLDKPGFFADSTQVMYGLMTSFLVANAAYPKLIGNVKYEPAELSFIYPNKASLQSDGNNRILNIQFSDSDDQSVYHRQLIPKRQTAVYQTDNKLAETLLITKSIRPTGIYPSSPLSRVVQQIYTKVYGNQHNASILKNGSAPGGMWTPTESGMSQDNYEAFKYEIQSKFTGPQNAGRNVVAPVPVHYEALSVSPKDMDFVNLIKYAQLDIYNLYNIPIALKSPETMTLSNFENSQTALYDLAVLPNAYMLLKRLGDFMLPRYKDGDRFELSFDEKTLPALRARMITNAQNMRGVGSFTENEIRQSTGYEPLEDGSGETIWKPSTLVPSGDDDDYEDDGTEDIPDETEITPEDDE